MDYNVGSNAFKQKKSDVNQSKNQRSRPLSSNSPTVATIIAKAVNASKLENNKLITVGKYGFALAGDIILNYYQLLLYGSKSSVLENVILTRDFKYNVYENNIVEFLSKENWRLEFLSTNDAVDFNSHMAFVVWKLNGLKELSWFDLFYPSRNDKLATFDSVVEITYVVNTIQGKAIGPEVSNNINDDRYLKVNISEDGWERSLLGVNDGTQRVIYIPNAETGAWKILTNGRQWLCLTVTVKNVYEVKENKITDLPIYMHQEPINKTPVNNSSTNNSSDIADEHVSNDDKITSNKICIETLYKEFEKLKIDNIETKERLTLLETLVKEKNAEKLENLNDLEFKKSMKTLYKNLIREFPIDQSFDGNQIQKIIKDVFSNTLMSHSDS